MITRRRIIGGVLGTVTAVPAGRIIQLKSMDNPLDKVTSPELVFVDNWVLDQQDISAVGT
ncbi:MAG: hypothetical protein ACJAXK_001827 [Yoonia sp.]|jgi:hypothetical protein